VNLDISYINGNSNSGIISFSRRIIPGHYCIFINPVLSKESQIICDMREKSAIAFNHLSNEETQRVLFTSYFNKNRSIIFSRLPDDKNINQKLPAYQNYIYTRFVEIAKSMELNGKLFKNNWNDIRRSPPPLHI
jgi:hypothetical protein